MVVNCESCVHIVGNTFTMHIHHQTQTGTMNVMTYTYKPLLTVDGKRIGHKEPLTEFDKALISQFTTREREIFKDRTPQQNRVYINKKAERLKNFLSRYVYKPTHSGLIPTYNDRHWRVYE